MDGRSRPDGPTGPLRHMAVRIRHDCPMARLSREVPGVRFTAWSGHGVEVVEVACAPSAWEGTVAAAHRHLDVQRAFPSPDGGLLVAEVHVAAERSISRTLEAHRCLWLQPMVLQDGWEHYDAIAFGPSEQPALDALAAHGPTRVIARR